MNEVDNFLKRFHISDDIDEVFTCGCCYWFAYILFRRFIRSNATIMYDEVANHFGTMVGGRVYDITGDVSSSYSWRPWDDTVDKTLRERIIRDCIMF